MKEVWKVAKPLHKIVHTLGWPLRKRAKYGEFGGSFVYPMGDEHVSLGFVVGLEYADVELSAHDLLQEFKTHRLIRKILEGGERVAWGAKTITEGGLLSLPSRLNAPGLAARRRGRRARQRAAPQGRALRDRVGSARRRGGGRRARARRGRSAGAARSTATTQAVRESYVWKELDEVRNMRQVFDKGFFMGGALASAMTVSKGKLPPKNYESHPNAETPLAAHTPRGAVSGAGREAHVRQALVRLRVGEPDARRPAEPRAHPDARCRATWPRCGSGCARRRCTRWARPTATGRSR